MLYGQSGGGLGDRTDYSAGFAPVAIIVGDLDGDGRLDLAVANHDGNTVSVLYGQPEGGFGGRTDYDVGVWPMDITAADFDDDGRLDLAVINNESNWGDISVLYGQPEGGFGGRTDYGTIYCPSQIVAADFNGDGRPDVVVSNAETGKEVCVFFGQPGGALGGRADYSLSYEGTGIATADFNADGRLDLTVRRPCGGLARRGENVYTDPMLLDVAGALEALPDLSVSGQSRADARQTAR